jgi:CRP-like cAMP-binding protein
MPNPPVDFRLLAGAGVAARDFKAGDVIFREGDPAKNYSLFRAAKSKYASAIVSSRNYRSMPYLEKWP